MIAAPLVRVARFVRERVPAHHLVYGITWSVAAESGAALLAAADRRGPGWSPGADSAARAAALVSTLVAVRMLDDVKDLEHDREYWPDRPLAAGRVHRSELLTTAGVSALGSVALASRALGPVSAVSLAMTQAYVVALWPLDRALRSRRDGTPSPVVDAALAYPTQALGTGFLLLSAGETGAAPRSRRALALIPIFAAAFLQFEITRKTRSVPPHGPSDYSSVLPWQACGVAIVALGEAAIWGLVAAGEPWRRRGARAAVTWSPAVLSVLSPLVVLDMARGRRSTPREAPSVAVLLALYLCIPLVSAEVTRP